MAPNRYGLTRVIPSAVKRAVRQRCGFGCIICGASIYEYDHFDPPFAEAREHRVAGIVLLCPTCHGLKSKGVLTPGRVAEFNASPAAVRAGYSNICLPHFKGLPALNLGGGVLFDQTPIPLRINDTPIVEFSMPEDGSDVTRVSAFITGSNGQGILRIVNNEWVVSGGVWDFEWVGQRMTIRNSAGEAVFQLHIAPPSYIGIDRLTTVYQNWGVRVTESEVRVAHLTMVECSISRFKVGIQMSSIDHPSRAETGFGFHILEEVHERPVRASRAIA